MQQDQAHNGTEETKYIQDTQQRIRDMLDMVDTVVLIHTQIMEVLIHTDIMEVLMATQDMEEDTTDIQDKTMEVILINFMVNLLIQHSMGLIDMCLQLDKLMLTKRTF